MYHQFFSLHNFFSLSHQSVSISVWAFFTIFFLLLLLSLYVLFFIQNLGRGFERWMLGNHVTIIASLYLWIEGLGLDRSQ